ncbi:zinc finger CCCH domain-containing protein 11A [Eurytemora carolleeae]|uniref:zinc finger CCCH domain-containing protein 11A n=1 Tax=Eurytemora carolleeae TaxID=1294199 RepID=UPI000C78D720|nr:zinc finger CCCH domain-containing protein 11A [Eurytemora carolleeae]|eukprot:XP_023337616.1 zinc finger CCCH domain-containing protein 11A-like [Eurytemora affinis]
MGPGYKTDDCYFYYNSICSKGYDCPYRHEAAARGSDVTCYYWQTVGCTRPNCSFRHSELSNPAQGAYRHTELSNPAQGERSSKQCFWELQSMGCQKTQCPFMHVKPRHHQIQTEGVKHPDCGSIIVNKKKLEDLQQILPVHVVPSETAEKNKPRRVVVPPGTGGLARRAVTGGIKKRLGVLGLVKNRLGSKGEEINNTRESSPDLGEESLEEIELRNTAIKTIDLRNRLDTKESVRSPSPKINFRPAVIKMKKSKKSRKESTKHEEKTKKKKRNEMLRISENEEFLKFTEKDVVSSRFIRTRPELDLPSASDYSDLDTPHGSPDPELISVISRTNGMHADTRIFSKSAKARLGKRKADTSVDSLTKSKILQVPRTTEKGLDVQRVERRPVSYAARVFGGLVSSKKLENESEPVETKTIRLVDKDEESSTEDLLPAKSISVSPGKVSKKEKNREKSKLRKRSISQESENNPSPKKRKKEKKPKKEKKAERKGKSEKGEKKMKKSKEGKKRRISRDSSKSPSPPPGVHRALSSDKLRPEDNKVKADEAELEEETKAENTAGRGEEDIMKQFEDFINE